MTERDEADAAAALSHSSLDELKRVAYSRPTSPGEAARSIEAQRLLAEHEERQARADAQGRGDSRAREASGAAEPAHPLHDGAQTTAPEVHTDDTEDEPRPARRRVAVIVAAVIAAVAAAALAIVLIANPGFDIVGSVTGDPDSAPSVSPTLPPPNPDFMNEVRDQLGPVPQGGTMSATELAAALATARDWDWESATRQYPGLQRPDVEVIRVIENHETSAVQVDCLVARGVEASMSSGDSYTYSASTEAEMLSIYRCRAEYPTRPEPELTNKQVGYLYDYQVRFAVPCLERLGLEQRTPPSRDEFIATWPEQNWRPDPGEVTGSTTSSAIAEACPTEPTGIY